MDNGIVGNLGASRRSLSSIAGMGMILKLSGSDSPNALWAMLGITILAVVYMVMDEIKNKRNGKGK